MKRIAQLIVVIILAITMSIGLQVDTANAQTTICPVTSGITSSIPPVYSFRLQDEQKCTTDPLDSTSATIAYKNETGDIYPLQYTISSSSEGCEKNGTLKDTKFYYQCCAPNGKSITIANTTDPSQGAAILEGTITPSGEPCPKTK